MAVGAAHLTLGDLLEDRLPLIRSTQHCRDAKELLGRINVVEMKSWVLAVPTINTRMIIKVLGQPLPYFLFDLLLSLGHLGVVA